MGTGEGDLDLSGGTKVCVGGAGGVRDKWSLDPFIEAKTRLSDTVGVEK